MCRGERVTRPNVACTKGLIVVLLTRLQLSLPFSFAVAHFADNATRSAIAQNRGCFGRLALGCFVAVAFVCLD